MFQDNLRYLLQRDGKTQKDLAEYVGVKQNTVSDWINQGTSPKLEHLCRITDFFNVSIDWLIKGEDREKIPQNVIEEVKPDEPLSRLLISNFKELSEEGQNELINQSAMLLGKEKEKKKADEEIVTRLVHSYNEGNIELKMPKATYEALVKQVEEYDPAKYKGLV